MTTELFAMAVWMAHLVRMGAHIAFRTQRGKLAPVMKKLRQGLLPATLIAAGFAPFTQAHGVPGALVRAGDAAQGVVAEEEYRNGISLDEAVRRAESQYRARVVRTEVQDEDGRKVYVLKLLSDDGRVVTVRIDAATGRMR
jgi:hypothetical protein